MEWLEEKCSTFVGRKHTQTHALTLSYLIPVGCEKLGLCEAGKGSQAWSRCGTSDRVCGRTIP